MGKLLLEDQVYAGMADEQEQKESFPASGRNRCCKKEQMKSNSLFLCYILYIKK
ncbi:hypothetical protein [Paenibacillus polymyxa]|uniref:hypothetical protein n=1 Tax=Paenibacillus polymyxa TaxID=1406 RepID=UPI000AE85ABD|nr:hypothetical protein [Paenibacillus polymyxa]